MPNGNGSKVVIIKVVGQIAVALLGLVGTALGVWAQVKSESTNAVLKATVDRIDEHVLPTIEHTMDELRTEGRVVVDNLGIIRERVARIEGKLEARRPGIRRPASTYMGPPTAEEEVAKRLDKLIIKGEQEVMNLPRMNFDQIQRTQEE